MVTRLYTTAVWYNPFYFDGLKINNIYFYREGKIIAETNWFGGGSNNDFWNIEFPFETKRAAKLNLNRQDAFYMRSDSDFEKSYDLYIHADLVKLECKGRKQFINDWKTNSTLEHFSITLTGERKVYSKDYNDKKVGRKQGTFTVDFTCNYQGQETKEYKKCEAIAKKWSKLTYRDFSASDVHAIMEAYNISEKRIKK